MLRLLVFALAAHVSCGSQFLFEMYTKEVDDTSPLMDENIFSQFLEDLGFENPLAAKCEVFKPPKNFRLNAKKFKKAFRKFKLQDYVVPHELENKLEQSIFHKFSKDRRWIEKEEFANFINNSHIYVTEFVEVALTNPLKLPYEIDFDSFLGELRSIARETNVKLSNIMQKVLKATRVLRVQDRCSRNIDTEEGDKSNRPQEEPNGDLPTLRFYDAYLTLRQPGKRVYHMNEAVFTQFLEDAGVNDVLATKCKVLKNVRHVGGDKKAGFKLGFPDFQNALDKILECPNPTSPFTVVSPNLTPPQEHIQSTDRFAEDIDDKHKSRSNSDSTRQPLTSPASLSRSSHSSPSHSSPHSSRSSSARSLASTPSSLPSILDLHSAAKHNFHNCITNVLQSVYEEETNLQVLTEKVFGEDEKMEFAKFAELINKAKLVISGRLYLGVDPKDGKAPMTKNAVVEELRNLALATNSKLRDLLRHVYKMQLDR